MAAALRPIRSSTLSSCIFAAVAICVQALEGPHVCVKKEKIQTSKLVPYQKAYQYREYEFCLDVKENFRCPTNKIGYRLAYKNVTRVEIILKDICCPYYIEDNGRCVPAISVSERLNSNERSSLNVEAVISVIIVLSLACIASLLAVVFYYRRKYMAEKDRSAYLTISDLAGSRQGKNEFDNPLYTADMKTKQKFDISAPRRDAPSRTSNVYEEMPWKRGDDVETTK